MADTRPDERERALYVDGGARFFVGHAFKRAQRGPSTWTANGWYLRDEATMCSTRRDTLRDCVEAAQAVVRHEAALVARCAETPPRWALHPSREDVVHARSPYLVSVYLSWAQENPRLWRAGEVELLGTYPADPSYARLAREHAKRLGIKLPQTFRPGY